LDAQPEVGKKMHRRAKIFVAGHRGMVGSAILRNLQAGGYERILVRSRAELDLENQAAVEAFFASEQPEYVFLAAAFVGGIHANNTYPAEFIYRNLAIQTHVIHAAYRHGVQRLLLLGSSCIYPKLAPQPLKESYLLTGPLEPTNRPYAVAKIAGVEMCSSYNRQYGTQYLSVMPTNLYGPGDNYDPENSHVMAALIGRFHRAKMSASPYVNVWGTGTPRREFLYSDDAGDACVFLMRLPDAEFGALTSPTAGDGEVTHPLVNVGVGEDLTIRDLAALVASVVGYDGEIRFDTSMPDGTPRKILDVGRMAGLGWRASVGLREGVKMAYEHFLRKGAGEA
jgi:GDP-L-fucose synthase